MITTRHMTAEVELVRWLLLIVAAIALLLAIATVLGADSTKEPRLLPKDAGTFARPMTPQVTRPFFPETPPGRQLPPAEAASRLWTILEHHRGGRALEALNAWDQVGLPAATAHWREIAIGAAYLQAGDLDRAALHLEAARQFVPENALVAYFTGLLRLEQATNVGRVPSGMPKRDRLVSYTPAEDKAVYQMLAVGELEMAIMRASELRFEERLLTVDSQVEDIMIVPTTGDLIAALGAENFVGKAHHVLYGLQLKRGELGPAEFHLDQAAATGITLIYGYRELAMAYLDQGRDTEAIRLLRKDLQIKSPWLGQFSDWLRNRTQRLQTSWVW